MRALLAALMLAAGPAAAETFVLVNGSWHGAWYWDPIVTGLEAAGHEAVAVEFRGQGARIAEGGPEVTVADLAADIVAAIEAQPEPVTLVAYSFGGRPATAAWDLARDRVARVIWVEAVAPTGTGAVAVPSDGRSLAFLVTMMPDEVDDGMLSPSPAARADPERPLAPMSLRALYGEVRLANGPLPDTPGVYIYAEDADLPDFRLWGEAMARDRGWRLASIPGGHDVVEDAPDQLLAALLWAVGD